MLFLGGRTGEGSSRPNARACGAGAGVNLWKNKTINRLTHGLDWAIPGRRGQTVAGLNWAEMQPRVDATRAPSPPKKCIKLRVIELSGLRPRDPEA
jgi:hypothetical protein